MPPTQRIPNAFYGYGYCGTPVGNSMLKVEPTGRRGC